MLKIHISRNYTISEDGKVTIEPRKPRKSRLDNFMINMEEAYQQGGLKAAQELCRNTKGKYATAAYLTLELIKKYK